MCLLLQVLDACHELNRVYDTVVIEEHARDLAGGVAVLLLDHVVDCVANLLTSLL